MVTMAKAQGGMFPVSKFGTLNFLRTGKSFSRQPVSQLQCSHLHFFTFFKKKNHFFCFVISTISCFQEAPINMFPLLVIITIIITITLIIMIRIVVFITSTT